MGRGTSAKTNLLYGSRQRPRKRLNDLKTPCLKVLNTDETSHEFHLEAFLEQYFPNQRAKGLEVVDKIINGWNPYNYYGPDDAQPMVVFSLSNRFAAERQLKASQSKVYVRDLKSTNKPCIEVGEENQVYNLSLLEFLENYCVDDLEQGVGFARELLKNPEQAISLEYGPELLDIAVCDVDALREQLAED